MNEFALENGQWKEAVKSSFTVLLLFIILPIAGFAIVSSIMSGITIMDGIDTKSILAEVWVWISRLSLAAIPLAIVAAPMGFYREGSIAKVPFRAGYYLCLGLWAWIATNGGHIRVDASSIIGAPSISSTFLNLDLAGIVLIIVALCIFRAALSYIEYKEKRTKYLDWVLSKDE